MNIYARLLLLVSLFLLLTSCGDDKPKNTKVQVKPEVLERAAQRKQETHKLLATVCTYCHRLQGTVAEGVQEVAPQMQVVVDIYKAKYPNKEDFVKAVSIYAVNPEKGTSLMESAVDTYGRMPNSAISQEDAKEIATYLFKYDFNQTQK